MRTEQAELSKNRFYFTSRGTDSQNNLVVTRQAGVS